MSMVDNRVVRMTFDNNQFEKNLKTTMESLSKFEKSLKLDGATAGFDELKKATDKLNMSSIGDKAEKEAKRIDQMSFDAKKSIDGIDDIADNADFSALSKAAGDAVNQVNTAAGNTDFTPASNAAMDAAIDINNAAGSVDLSNISDSANEAAQSFNALDIVATGVLLSLGDKIAGLATSGLSSIGSKIKDYTITPIVDGFKEYETQMGSIQTIMANTGMNFNSDDDIRTVNAALDELNTYADKTIYNFTEMTRNIGTFTAAGIELEPATKAIQGIANLAALSGSNSQQASTAMYQLSQALAAGSLKLQDWNSVVNAGMGGKVFQEALKETARVHHIAVDEIIEDAGSFRESLSEGWITADILTETLNHMAISYEKVGDASYKAAKKQLRQEGYTEDQAKAILKLAKQAEESATKVRTWTQLWDTVKEAIGSQWSSVFRNVVGDFKQATDTFTFMSKTISNGVDAMLGGIVRAAERFNASGGISIIFGGYKRDKNGEDVFDKETNELVRLKGAIDYLVEAIAKPLKSIKDAFDSVFGITNKQLDLTIVSLALAFRDFAKSLVISDNAATGLRRIFEGLFSIVDVGLHLILDLGAAFFSVVKILRIFIDPLIDIVLVLSGQLGKVVLWIHDKLMELRAAFVYMITPIGDFISAIGSAISKAMGINDIVTDIENFGESIIDILEYIWDLIDLPGKLGFIGDVFRTLTEAVKGTDDVLDSLVDIVKKSFGSIGEYVFPVVSFIFDFFKTIVGGIGYAAFTVMSAIASILVPIGKSLFEIGKAIGNIIASGFPIFVDLIVDLGHAIGNFATKMWNFFLAWEPIKGIIQIVQDFKTKVIDFFIGIPKEITESGDSLAGSLSDTQDIIQRIVTWLESIINKINNLSPEEALKSIKSGFSGVVDSVKQVVDNIENISFEKVAGRMISELHDLQTNIIKIMPRISKYLSNIFPSYSVPIRKFFENTTKFISSSFSNVEKIILDAKQKANSMPEFIGYLLGSVTSIIIKGVGNIVKTIGGILATVGISIGLFAKEFGSLLYDSFKAITSGEGFGKVAELWKDFGSSLNRVIEDTLRKINPSFAEIYDKIIGFFSSIVGESSGWRVALSTAFGVLKEEFKDLPNKARESFDKFKKIITDALESLVLKLSGISGPIGKFFSMLWDRMQTTKQNVQNGNIDIVDSVENTTSTIKQKFIDLWKNIKAFFIGSKDSADGGFIGRIVEFFSGKSSQLINSIKNLPNGFGEFLDNVIKAFSPERIEKIKDIIVLVAKIKLFASLRELMSGLGKLSKAFARRISKEDNGTFNEKLRNWAITFAILGATLWVISTIPDPGKALIVLTLAGAVVLGLAWLSALSEKKLGKNGGTQLLEAAAALAIVAVALRMIMKTVEMLTEFDYVKNKKGLAALGGFMLIFAVWTKFLGDGGKNAAQAAAGLLIMSVALRMFIKPIQDISNIVNSMNDDELKKARDGIAAVALFMIGLGGALQLAGKHAISSGVAFVLMAFAVDIIVDAMSKLVRLATLNVDAAVAVMGGIAILMAEFAAIAQVVSIKEMLTAGAGLLLFAGSVTIISDAIGGLVRIAKVKFESIVASFVGISALMIIFATMAKIVKPKELLSASAAMIVFSASMSIIASALSKLTELDAEKLTTAAWAMAGIVGVFGILVAVLSQPALAIGATTVLPMLSLAFIALGAACLMIGVGLEHAVAGILQLATASPTLLMFVNTIASNLMNFILASVAIGALGTAFAMFGPTAAIAGAGIFLLANGIRDFLLLLIDLPVLLPMVGESLSEVFTMILEKTGGLIPLLSTWWVSTAWPWLVDKFNVLREWFVKTALPAIGQWLSGFIRKAKEFIANLGAWWAQNGPVLLTKAGEFIVSMLGKIGEFIPKIKDWALTKGIPTAVECIRNIIDRAREYFGEKISTFISSIPSVLSQKIESIRQYLEIIGGNIIAGVVNGIRNAPSSIAQALLDAAGAGLNSVLAFFGIASPSKLMRDKVGRYIPEGLAIGIRKFAVAVTEASEDMAYDANKSITRALSSADYTLPSPSVSPVMNMADMTNGLSTYNKMLKDSMIDDNLYANTKFAGEMSMSADLASKLDADMDGINSLNGTMYDIQQALYDNMVTTENLNNKTNAILEVLGGDAAAIRSSLSRGMGLYIDKDTFVGAIAPEMDSVLGKRALLAGRGVY